MNTCQLERSEKATTFNFLPFHSTTLGQTKQNLFGISVLHPPTLMIRSVASEQLKQILQHPLTERELCVLKMIVDGHSNLAIAQELYISVGTVKTHVRNIFSKLNVSDRTQAAVVALRSGLVD